MNNITFLCFVLLTVISSIDAVETDGNKPVVLLLLGPPGSGRSTLAVKLSKTFSIPHLTAASLLQDHIREDTEIGQKVRDYLNSRGYIPDTLILQMLYDYLKHQDKTQGFVLAGIPRTLEQAQELKKALSNQYQFLAMSICVSDEVLLLREEGRLVCQDCGRVYHKLFSPPHEAMKCDQCKKTLIQRDVDTPENLHKKLDEYRKSMEPVLTFYKNEEILREINGNCTFENTFEEVKSACKNCAPDEL
ncbi:MAG: adk1 [Chlamydiia bacterium]|nr:adk1 [Chlamydiia bacterium]